MNQWIARYIKGCAPCQQNKNLTHRRKTPLFRIPPHSEALPFKIVAMDLITQLPKSDDSDAILTIVDQGCTRAAIFLPCSTAITGEGVAQLYLENIYQWFGLPEKVISNRDPCFTLYFTKALCEKLQIQQNISSVFHPQTDGLSERANQWIEQFLCLVAGARQDDWKHWLPIATATHNNHHNTTTKVPPAVVLLGYLPTLYPAMPSATNSERVEKRAVQAQQAREQAQTALQKMAGRTPEDQFQPGDQVWLEVKNLALPYQMRKLAPKRHGPFTITKQVSPVAYQLRLPPAWTIHDVFHASLLTPYHETPEHGANHNSPPPEMIKGEAEYEVKAIMGHCFFSKGRKLQYLIRWKGYSAADDTWEPAGQVFAPQLIAAYHRKHPKGIPFPHKRNGRVTIMSIPSAPLCQTPLGTPPVNRPPHQPQCSHRSPYLCRRLASRWTKTKSSLSRLLSKFPLPSPLAQPSPSYKPLGLEGALKPSETLHKLPHGPSSLELPHMRTRSTTSKKRSPDSASKPP
jgi:hypothetical protein